MTKSLWKDILYPGRWHCRDGRTFDCSPQEIPYFQQRMKDMVDAGLPIPLSWEHQPQLKPGDDSSDEARANRAKFALGCARNARSSAGFLEAELDVPLEEDRKRLPAVRFVSPFIEWDFVDGKGRKWEGPSITHIAVTPRPIQHTQQPFAMSHNGAKAPIALSIADYEGPMDDEKDKKKKPADDDTTAADDATPGDEVTDTTDADTPPDATVTDDDGAPGFTDADAAELVELLAAHKIILGEGVTASNFTDRLKASLHTKAAHDGTAAGGPNDPNTQATATEVGEIGLSADAKTWKQRAERAETKIVAMEHKAMLGRIKQLGATGRINKTLRESLERDAKSVSLSLDSATGNVNGAPLIYKIEAYEQLPVNKAFADPTALSHEAKEVEPPKHLTKKDDDRKEEQEKAGDDIASMAGCRKKAA